MTHTQRSPLTRLAGAFAIALTMIAGPARSDSPDLSGVNLIIGIQSSGSSAAVALLEASGAFADTPYTIEWANFDGANAAVEALNAGAIDIDVGLNFSAPILNQANATIPWTADDRPFVIIGAAKQLNRAGIALIVSPDSGINSIQDLIGGSVSFAKGTANHYFFALAADAAGIPLDQFELVLMPLSEARAAFVGGSVDALVTAISNSRPLVTSGDGQVIATSEGLFDSYSWLVARPEVLEDPARAAAVADVIVRLQNSVIWESQNVDEVARIFSEVGRQEPADALLNAQESTTAYVPIDAEVIAANQRQATVFHDAGVAESLVDASIGFDARFNDVVIANPGPTGTSAVTN